MDHHLMPAVQPAFAAKALAHIDRRLNTMLVQPDGWGAHGEVELQCLQLLEVRALLLGGHAASVLAAHGAFMRKMFPTGSPPTKLAVALDVLGRNEDFARILCAFVTGAQSAQNHAAASHG
jgi:hypothetical protein